MISQTGDVCRAFIYGTSFVKDYIEFVSESFWESLDFVCNLKPNAGFLCLFQPFEVGHRGGYMHANNNNNPGLIL